MVQLIVPPADGREGAQLHPVAVTLVGVRSAGIVMVAVRVWPLVVLVAPALVMFAVKDAVPPRATVVGGVVNDTAGSEAPPLVNVTSRDAELFAALPSPLLATLEVKVTVETPAGMPFPSVTPSVMVGNVALGARLSLRVQVKLEPMTGVPQDQPDALDTVGLE